MDTNDNKDSDIINANDGFNLEDYKIALGTHKDKSVIWMAFPYDAEKLRRLKQQLTVHWSVTQKCWYAWDLPVNRHHLNIQKRLVGKEVLQKIHPINIPEFEKYQRLLRLKAYSPNTFRTYCLEFAQLLYAVRDHPIQEFTAERLQSYFYYCTQELKLSENLINSRINATKFYFEQVLHRDKMFFDIPRPKTPLLLPKYLNANEVKRLFEVTDNIKHRLILKLVYGMGLRVSEIVVLKVADIDSGAMKVCIHRGKGKKDRYANLPESVLPELRAYYKEYYPEEYLFEGQNGGHYSVRSAQLVFKSAMKKAKIRKKIGIHCLRHSYATHLLELGTDVTLIQKLLGHNNVKTTMIYTHVTDRNLSSVRSPLDQLPEK